MASPRRIVPDNSVIIPAFFKESARTQYSQKLVAAVQSGRVKAFAPEILLHEFIKVAFAKDQTLADPEITDRIEDFFTLNRDITYVPGAFLVSLVLQLRSHHIYLPDSWYVACAIHYKAELWISHNQKDDLLGHAKEAGVRVCLLNTWK